MLRSILVLNPKGGCGKTTLTTNLAAQFASRGRRVLLADADPQASSLDWLAARPGDRPVIHGVDAREDDPCPGADIEVLLIDAPARTHGKELKRLLKLAQTVLVPVQPSPIDIRAAGHFIVELLTTSRIEKGRVRAGLIANRVREFTLAFHKLEHFLRGLDVPVITRLRDTQNYVHAAERGLGVCELAPSAVAADLEQWTPLLRWLASAKSLPAD